MSEGHAMILRPGTRADGGQAVALLRRSITELCTLDHRGDAASVAEWLANKTETTWAAWVGAEDATLLVAESEGRLLGVAMASHAGAILLAYVHPDARFRGVSTALLAALERDAATRGLTRCTVESTRTAEAFYRRRGYVPVSDGRCLEKRLARSTFQPARNGPTS